MEKKIFHEKIRACIIGSDDHGNVQISDQTLSHIRSKKSNANVTSEMGFRSLANANVLKLTRFGNHFPTFE